LKEGKVGAMADDSFRDYVLDQLRGLSGVRFRSMFGGYGIYSGDRFFGILYQGRLYFKTHEGTREGYTEAGMKPFRTSEKQTLKNYYEVPPDVLDDDEVLKEWAREAIRIAGE